MAIIGSDGTILDVNEALCRFLRRDKLQLIGQKVVVLFKVNAKRVRLEIKEFSDDPETLGRMLVVLRYKAEFERWGEYLQPKSIDVPQEPKIRPRINPAIKQYGLTKRDLEILVQVSTGAADEEIAARLDLSAATVAALKHLLHCKLHVTSDVSLIQRGNDLELLGQRAY